MNEVPVFGLTSVRKEYGTTLAVEIQRFVVPNREILCLLGPTGAGKSTLLRLLAGVEEPTSGTLLHRGKPLHQLPHADSRRITLVFQRPILMSGSVKTNVEYGLRLRGNRAPKNEQAS